MRTTVDLTVVCTVEDQFRLLELTRAEIDAAKPIDDRAAYYPSTVTEALQQVIRTAIAGRLLSCDAISLHEIGHTMREVELPRLE